MREKFDWLNQDSITFMKRGYLEEGVEPKERVKQIADTVEKLSGIKGFSEKFYTYMANGWISLSTPIWCNYGLERGLPISCFGTEYKDDTADILRGVSEIGMLSKMGGGTAGYFGNLRARGESIKGGGKTNGSIAFMEIFDTLMSIITQGASRRGSFAAYLPVDHDDIDEFLTIRNDESPIQNLSLGVTIPEGWMQSMIDGDIDKRNVWVKILKKRAETGYPYLFFSDNVNNNKPQVYKDKRLDIKTSQLCSEILEITNEEYSFTCCLSSVNLLHYEEWKDTDLVETLTIFLDTVLDEFIKKASDIPFMEKTIKFAKECRSIGLGVLGLHSYLQKNMIPFEGMETKMLLNKIFSNINNKSFMASKMLAKEKGEPKMLEGYGERFTTRLAIAPTTSSSFILGQVSPSIEPLNSNYFVKDVAKGKFTFKNPFLIELLEEKGRNKPDVWKSILLKGGSIQHLSFLTEDEKNVFKTFGEISQMEIIQNTSIIQKYIDQGISLNTMIHPDTPVKDINALIIEAWKLGIKTLYYQRSTNKAQELSRNLMECVSCEG
jgi:ribonucleoside-diphosphate reductase alpha chain